MERQTLLQLLSEGPKKPRALPPDEDPTEEFETIDEAVEPSNTAGAVTAPAKVTVVNLFRHPAAHPIVLDLFLLRKYGPDILAWEPETLEIRIPQDFHVTGISDINMSKIQAAKTLHLVDTFWERWEVFVWCTMSFNSLFPDFDSLQVPTISQCLVAADVANRIREDVEWSEEVKAFVASVFRFEGIFCPMEPCGFVTLDTEGLPVDCSEVLKKWPAVRDSGHVPSEESITNEQLRRMLLAYDALRESREVLRSQLSLVEHV